MSENSVDEHFDVIIIGTGSGNSLPSEDFADKKIAICEEWTFGGTCLNRGCIPTKMFVFPADQAAQQLLTRRCRRPLSRVRPPDPPPRMRGRFGSDASILEVEAVVHVAASRRGIQRVM